MQSPARSLRLVPRIEWTIDGDPPMRVDRRLLDLLAAIRQHGSLYAAAPDAGLSYRAAWGLLRTFNEATGSAAVVLAQGRGAFLTAAGERLLLADAGAGAALPRFAEQFAVDLPEASRRRGGAPTLRISASHDLAVALLREPTASRAKPVFDITFKGSLEAVQDLAAGRADIAGFHVPLGRGAARHWAPFRRWLDASRMRIVRFVDREQGLIVAAGNPLRIRSLRDVARRGLRFVNRQTGSGTRLLVDAMLARQHVAPRAMRGYEHEEFTHTAVAATIAASHADAGFGIRAVADEFGLAFIPVVRERYYFACALSAADAKPLHDALADRGLFDRIAALSGYDPRGINRMASLPRPARRAR